MRKYYPNFSKQFIHKRLTKFWRASLDLLFPRHCLSCQKDGTWLCQKCLVDLPRSYCSGEENIFSVFDYNSPAVKQLIWHLKYKRTLELAEILAKPLHDCLLEELEDELIVSPKIILIPVPLSPARYRLRGYNQSEELAKQIVALNPNQFEINKKLIKKIKNTPTQVSIRNRDQRLENLKNAFALGKSEKSFFAQLNVASHLSNIIFVIIDDVSTTGATINEIRKLLAQTSPTGNKINPHRLYGLVVAHG